MSALADYLSRALDRKWCWGELDCFLFCADWVCAATGIDPASEFRGAYASEREARRLIKASGGIVALAEHCMMLVAPIVALACPGDVGLVRVPLMRRGRRLISVPAGAICLGGATWTVRTREGLVARRFAPLRVWGLGIA